MNTPPKAHTTSSRPDGESPVPVVLPPLPTGYTVRRELTRGSSAWTGLVDSREGPAVLRIAQDAAAESERAAELSVLAGLRHPNLAQLIDHGTLPGGASFVARAWIEGRDLRAHVRDLPTTGDARARAIGAIAVTLCDALAYLHDSGFVHADVKAENVIVGESGEAVLTDFGLARARASGPAGDHAFGSPYAIAPEVLLGGEATPRSDLFGLGMMLVRLWVEEHARVSDFYARFPGVSALEALRVPTESLPEWGRDVVAALLSVDPDSRPQHAAVVGATLASRLALVRAPKRERPRLAFPLRAGRTAFLEARCDAYRARGGADRFGVESWTLPRGESPREWSEDARLFAALRGLPTRSLDVGALGGLDPKDVDRFARDVASSAAGLALFCGVTGAAHERRVIEHLARTARQSSERGEPAPTMLYVSWIESPDASAPSRDAWWKEMSVPRVELAHVREFLAGSLEEPSSERRDRLAALLVETSEGAAARVGERLRTLVDQGWILAGDTRPRLRAGALPDRIEDGAQGADASPLTADARRLCAALAASDTAVPLSFALELSGVDPRAGAESARASLARGLVRNDARTGLLRFVGSTRALGVDAAELRRLHARLSERRRDNGDPAITWLHHRWRATIRDDASAHAACVENLLTVSEEARERGAVDSALELHARLERAAHDEGVEIEPALLAESAVTWIAAGAVDRAVEIAERLDSTGDATVSGLRERVRGLVAFARGDYEDALTALARAESLDPRLARELVLARARVLYDARRDDELERLASSLSDDVPERVRANVHTLVAMSLARRGELDAAGERLSRLLVEARALADASRQAALELNLGTIERRRGRLDDAVAAFHRGLALLEKTGNLASLAQARVLLGGLWRERNDLIAAGPLLEGAAALRERLGDRAGAAAARGLLGLVHADRGHARAALSELTRAASDLLRLSRRVDAALLEARAEEVRARLGEPASSQERARGRDGARSLDADPRALLSRARAAWMRRDVESAIDLARRARDLARSVRQPAPEREAEHVLAELERRPGARGSEAHSDDERVVAAIGGAVEPEGLRALAEEMTRQSRDDRAARAWFALAARTRSAEEARAALESANASFAACAAGLSTTEARALRSNLLSRPDPTPDDFATLDARKPEEEDFPMDVLELLEINRRLVAQEALPDLLGAIVDSALSVTAAERGFVVLEENGEIAIQTALDSRRGDIAAPEVEVSHSIVRQALTGGTILRLSNAVDDPELGDAPSVAALELRSILCAPFDIEPGARGVVYVDHRLRRGAFDARAERMLGLLAGQAALAIRQVRRFDEIKRLNRELEREVVHKDSDLRAARAALRAAALVPPASGLVGESSAMRAVHELLARSAPTRLPVLVTGPSGTGKELAARALHAQSTRADGPFLAENVAALPASLIEAELFGYKKGAYTGADADRPGLFERADGGTVFLDELGELPIELQAKLLRVLETGEVRRLGDSVTRSTDFRLVAATNRNLDAAVAAGRFRADLLYRLDALRIAMPPLEQRVSDIPLLVDHFLRLEEAKGGPPRRISPEVVARLCSRAWPGNVRELSNEVSRLCVLSAGDIVDPSLVRAPGATSAPASAPTTVAGSAPVRTLAELERAAIENAIAAAGGDKGKAAEMLGISRAKIYQRVKEWREGGEDAKADS